MRDVMIRGQTIDLDQLLKLVGIAATGGEAKLLIRDGAVHVNGQTETRRRRKLTPGDRVTAAGEELRVTAAPPPG